MIFTEFKWRQQTWYTNWPQFMLRWFFWLSEFREFSEFKKISRIRIEFSLNRDAFCRFYRITRKEKKSSSKMLPPPGSEPRASDCTALHANIWANSPICWKSQASQMVMLEWKVTLSRYMKSAIGTQKKMMCNNTHAKILMQDLYKPAITVTFAKVAGHFKSFVKYVKKMSYEFMNISERVQWLYENLNILRWCGRWLNPL